jgi:MerR family redox-sensitive transcriptional activator SoxR
MPLLTISEVARQVGLQPSAIRYYEQIGILLPAQRISGQRRYDTTVLYRLAVIQRARQTGFTLDEIRQLFFGFGNVTRASERWQKLSSRKLAELDGLMDKIKTVQRLLKKMMRNCRCHTLEQCGKGILRGGCRDAVVKSRPANRRHGRQTVPGSGANRKTEVTFNAAAAYVLM